MLTISVFNLLGPVVCEWIQSRSMSEQVGGHTVSSTCRIQLGPVCMYVQISSSQTVRSLTDGLRRLRYYTFGKYYKIIDYNKSNCHERCFVNECAFWCRPQFQNRPPQPPPYYFKNEFDGCTLQGFSTTSRSLLCSGELLCLILPRPSCYEGISTLSGMQKVTLFTFPDFLLLI